jgi:hypothetical protein
MTLLQDFKERFLNFETAKGVYLIPAGLVLCYVTLMHLQYLIQAWGLLCGVYMSSEGMRKVFVNRVKQKIATETLVEKRLREMDIKATVQAVEETLRAGEDNDLAPGA